MSVDRYFRVLLVEDNPLDARMIRRALAEGNSLLEVVLVDTLEAALQTIDNLFDAVLLDLSLPDSEGLDSLAAVLEAHSGSAVVVLTGLDDPDVAMEAMERGAQDWLTKSTVTPELLERALRYAVARNHSEAELLTANTLVQTMNARDQIARDLHDTVIQRLFATGMNLQGALATSSDELIARRAADAVGEIDGAIDDLREAIFGLHQYNHGSLAAELEAIAARHNDAFDTPINIRVDNEPDMSTGLRYDLVSIIAEAAANVVQHAKATTMDISVGVESDRLRATVADDGVGRPFQQTPGAGPSADRRGNGLRNMARRARRHGGRCTVEPGLDHGTVVTVTIPL